MLSLSPRKPFNGSNFIGFVANIHRMTSAWPSHLPSIIVAHYMSLSGRMGFAKRPSLHTQPLPTQRYYETKSIALRIFSLGHTHFIFLLFFLFHSSILMVISVSNRKYCDFFCHDNTYI